VGVVSIERGDQGGSNGGGYRVAVAVLSKIRSIENRLEKWKKKVEKSWTCDIVAYKET
jgi:hypothetical protein